MTPYQVLLRVLDQLCAEAPATYKITIRRGP